MSLSVFSESALSLMYMYLYHHHHIHYYEVGSSHMMTGITTWRRARLNSFIEVDTHFIYIHMYVYLCRQDTSFVYKHMYVCTKKISVSLGQSEIY